MSVVTFPKYPINGLDPEAESTRLHFKKNQPDRPDIEFPPYHRMPYPCALYRREGDETVSRMCGTNDTDVWTGDVDATLRVQNDAEKRALLADGWTDNPRRVDEAKREAEKRIAAAAAESAFNDLKMGEKARREREAVDAASDDHVVDVPEARRQAKEKR